MSFERQKAEATMRDILQRIRNVNYSIQESILKYREKDTLVDEADEHQTMRDIRYLLLENYHKIDRILTDLDKYKE